MKYNPALDGLRALAVLAVIGATTAFGAHTRTDPGAFRIAYPDHIEPVDGGLVGAALNRKPILLTFDDGPQNAETDARILGILRKHHAHAAWFITCKDLDPAIDPDAMRNRATLRRIVAEGHVIANHGYGHVNLKALPADRLQHEIGGCSDAIAKVSGVRPRYFRPPWGVATPAVEAHVQAAGMRIVEWGPNSYDSLLARFKAQPETFVPFVAANPVYDVARNAESGDVLLFHDYPNTALALDGILTRLEAHGFQFVVPG